MSKYFLPRNPINDRFGNTFVSAKTYSDIYANLDHILLVIQLKGKIKRIEKVIYAGSTIKKLLEDKTETTDKNQEDIELAWENPKSIIVTTEEHNTQGNQMRNKRSKGAIVAGKVPLN